MIYPDTPTCYGISLSQAFTEELDEAMQELGLYHYGLFKGIYCRLIEVKHGFITLEITYPECLTHTERDQKFILMVMAYAMNKPILDHIFNVLLIEYEGPNRPGFTEFGYYSDEERNHRIEDALFASIERRKVKETILDRDYLIELFNT